MKVLHIDRNSFYGGEGASVNLTNLWKIFKPNAEVPKQYGANRDWNIDLVPKFIMSNGKLVKILLKTRVAKYLEWKCNAIFLFYPLTTHMSYFFLIKTTQPSIAHTSTKTRREVSSHQVVQRSRRSLLLIKKPCKAIWWESWKSVDARISSYLSRTASAKSLRLTRDTISRRWPCASFLPNSIWNPTPLISLVMLSHSTLTITSLRSQLSIVSKKSSSTWTPLVDMVIPHSSIQCTDLVVSLKVSLVWVQSWVEHSCSTPILTRSCTMRLERFVESNQEIKSQNAKWSYVILPTRWRLAIKDLWRKSDRSWESSASLISLFLAPKISLQLKSSFLKDKSTDRMVINSFYCLISG